MPHIDKIFPSRYLKAGDLDGREHIVTIKGVKLENVGQSKDSKPVLYFKGAQKGLVLNVTNSKRIANMTGSKNTDDWAGHKLIIYPTETEFAGETVDCIRVKAIKGTAPVVDEDEEPVKATKKPKKAKPVVEEPDDAIPTREPGDESVSVATEADAEDIDEIPF